MKFNKKLRRAISAVTLGIFTMTTIASSGTFAYATKENSSSKTVVESSTDRKSVV